MSNDKSTTLFKEANKYIPGGVNSPVRAFKSVGGNPLFIKGAKGAYLFDEDNNSYIDYINSWGPMILGHNPSEVIFQMQEQLVKGVSFGAPTNLEVQMAKLACQMLPSADKIRMVNSGTEACMTSVRLARAYTSKSKIIKFEGCYHGHSDSFLIQAGSGAATLGEPNSPGVTESVAKDTITANYNNLDSVKAIFEEYPEQIACIIVEPVAGNMGCIAPKPGFLEGLKAICEEHNALFVLDEVMTGFRLAKGGAQELYNIHADIVCLGKIIGGGLPVGAVAGRAKFMDLISPLGKVYQAGTLSGNPLAMAAGFSILSELNNNASIYKKIEETTKKLDEGISAILTEKGIAHTTNRVQSMFTVFFSPDEVYNFSDAKKADNSYFKKFFRGMIKHGVYIPPSSYESWFVSAAIQEDEISKTLEAVKKTVKTF